MKKYTENKILRDSFKRFEGDTINDIDLRNSIAREIGAHSVKNHNLYGEILDFIIKFLSEFDKDNLQELKLFYKFICFTYTGLDTPYIYSSTYETCEDCQNALKIRSDKIYNLIDKNMSIDEFHIYDTNHQAYRGDFSEIFEYLLRHYNNSSYKFIENKKDDVRVKISTLVPKLYCKYPKLHDSMLYGVFEFHPNYHEEHAKLISLFLKRGSKDNLYGYLVEMLHFGEFSEDRIQKEAKKILASLWKISKDWDDDICNLFVEQLVLKSLGIVYEDYESVFAYILRNEKENDERLEKNPYSWTTYDPDRALIRESFDLYKEAKFKRAVKKVVIGKSLLSTLTFIDKNFNSTKYNSLLKKLLEDATTLKNRPKLYNLNTKPKIIFKDFAFKLLVIENLMYTQKLLTPKFELSRFVEESKRYIDPYSDGYEPIAEVKKFYKNLDISQEMLEKISVLHVGLGFQDEEYSQTYINMWPQYDPGCQDLLKLKTKSLEDAKLLVNLKKIEGCGVNEVFSKSLINKFKKEDIDVVAWEY